MTFDARTLTFGVEDLSQLDAAYRGELGNWDELRHYTMRLPDWFTPAVDVDSEQYTAMQHRLWKAIIGTDREYDPATDEQTLDEPHNDVVRFPGGFVRRDKDAVRVQGDHFIATGMFMKNSGIEPGQSALEYGAGFGGAALQMARLGVNVDTVDVSEFFCDAIKQQADFFQVPLTPFVGEFGYNPRGNKKYDLIFFYESFHHCLDYKNVVPKLKEYIKDTGVVMMAGEPVRDVADRYVPYGWCIRLDAENIAIMRQRRWFELGFLEDYLVQMFVNAGFVARKMDCPVSAYGSGYIFQHRPDTIHLGSHWLPVVENQSWNGYESNGRWTRGTSYISMDTSDTFNGIRVDMSNHHPVGQTVTAEYGSQRCTINIGPGAQASLNIEAGVKSPKLTFNTTPIVPSASYVPPIPDNRELGIFINTITYTK